MTRCRDRPRAAKGPHKRVCAASATVRGAFWQAGADLPPAELRHLRAGDRHAIGCTEPKRALAFWSTTGAHAQTLLSERRTRT